MNQRTKRAASSLLDRAPRGAVAAISRRPRAQRLFRPLLNVVLPSEVTTVTVRAGGGAGLKLVIDPQSEKFYWTGNHEPHIQEALKAELRPGMQFWDVGTHIGFFSLQAARLVGDGGCVRAFEPMPDNIDRIKRNIELNGASNVTVVPVAVSAEAGSATMYARHGSSLMWTLDPTLGDTPSGSVPLATLDSYLDEFGVPDLVKIDAEGAEVDVLRGSSTLIAEGRTSFLVEFMSEDLENAGRELLAAYSFVPLGDNHWLLRAPNSAR